MLATIGPKNPGVGLPDLTKTVFNGYRYWTILVLKKTVSAGELKANPSFFSPNRCFLLTDLEPFALLRSSGATQVARVSWPRVSSDHREYSPLLRCQYRLR
jgi:hypothetical protein